MHCALKFTKYFASLEPLYLRGGVDKFQYLLLKHKDEIETERWSDLAKVTSLLGSKVEPQTLICSILGLKEVAGGGIRLKKLEKRL